jgi:hypothetical protein
LAPKHEFEHNVKMEVEARVRQGVKAVLEEEMTQHLKAGYRELTLTRRGERNGCYQRNLLTPAGKIEHLTVPRDREGIKAAVFVELPPVPGGSAAQFTSSATSSRTWRPPRWQR